MVSLSAGPQEVPSYHKTVPEVVLIAILYPEDPDLSEIRISHWALDV